MRKLAAAVMCFAAAAMFAGCSKAEVEETIQPLVADAIEEADSEAEAVEDEDNSPLIPEIDTDVEIQSGARIAVVSKSTKGEYWKQVKKGMEDAVKAYPLLLHHGEEHEERRRTYVKCYRRYHAVIIGDAYILDIPYEIPWLYRIKERLAIHLNCKPFYTNHQ